MHTHFATFFAANPPLLPLSLEALRDFVPFLPAVQDSLHHPLMVAKLRAAFATFNPSAAPGPFGVEAGVL